MLHLLLVINLMNLASPNSYAYAFALAMYHLSFYSRRPVSADSKSILLFAASLLAEKLSIAFFEADDSASSVSASVVESVLEKPPPSLVGLELPLRMQIHMLMPLRMRLPMRLMMLRDPTDLYRAYYTLGERPYIRQNETILSLMASSAALRRLNQ